MKLRHVSIRNFKGVRELDFSIEDSLFTPRVVTAILGDNGSGKTSVLQAIALTLSLATGRTPSPDQFDWNGFLAERTGTFGETFVGLVIEFDEAEIAATYEAYKEWSRSLAPGDNPGRRIEPTSQRPHVELHYARGTLSCPLGTSALNQFLGRYYLGQLLRTNPEAWNGLLDVGDVYWFDQHRNLGTHSPVGFRNAVTHSPRSTTHGWSAGVEDIRESLVGWWGLHTSSLSAGEDKLAELQHLLSNVFGDLRFAGLRTRNGATRAGSSDFYVMLESGDPARQYNIAEMSSGEQAVFALAYQFARLNITRSIVLIDELELHLHPPHQQMLLNALPALGKDNQFLVTTHSEAVSAAIPNEHEVRMEGGLDASEPLAGRGSAGRRGPFGDFCVTGQPRGRGPAWRIEGGTSPASSEVSAVRRCPGRLRPGSGLRLRTTGRTSRSAGRRQTRRFRIVLGVALVST
jgi:predicted ATPase